jgi:hypothetical protein
MRRKLPILASIVMVLAGMHSSATAQTSREDRARHEAGLRGRGQAPKIGDPAPKVSAKAKTDGAMVDLSKPKRVTVLVFGSHT